MKTYLNETQCPYPRLCAHRGLNMAAPENTLPAFAAAVALGAEEVELDLWPDRDGDLIVCHDPSVDRTSDGYGLIRDLSTKQIRALDAGSWYSPAFQGTRFPLFEEVLELVGRRTILNIHIKSPAVNKVRSEKMMLRGRELNERHSSHAVLMPPLPETGGEILPEVERRPLVPYPETDFLHIIKLLDSCNCRDYAYITGEADVLTTARGLEPDMPRCCLEGHMNYSIVEHAVEYGCKKLQFCKGLTTQGMIDRARRSGLICNLFWADTPEEAEAYMKTGIDCVLTNNWQPVRAGLERYSKAAADQ